MPVSSLEREVKLDASPRFELPDLNGVLPGVIATPHPDAELQATYFDTPDLRLMGWGVTLRHRHDAAVGSTGEMGWTVKLPGDADGVALARTEHSWPGGLGPVPPEVASLVRAQARSSPLGPVATLTTQRGIVELRDAEGTKLAEVDDDLVSVRDGRRLASRFRQIEVEMTDAASDALVAEVLHRLALAGAVAGNDRPKVVRALGPRADLGPDIVIPELGPKAAVATVVAAAIAAGATRIIRHDPGVRLDDDPEHVHQARVGTRRLRSDLQTFGPLLDPDWARPMRAELGWLAAALGEVRDADVLTSRLRAEIRQLADRDARPAAALLRRLAVEREEARSRLLGLLNCDRYVVLLEDLARAATDPPLRLPAPVTASGTPAGDRVGSPTEAAAASDRANGSEAPAAPSTRATAVLPSDVPGDPADAPTGGTPQTTAVSPVEGNFPVRNHDDVPLGERRAGEVLPALVRRPWRRLQAAVDALGQDPPDEALHQVRIRAKRVRYAAEAVAGVIGKPAHRLAAAVAEVQGVLGDLQDSVVAEAWLRRHAAAVPAARALVAGQLVTLERQKQADLRRAWRKPSKAAAAKKLRTWLKR